MSAGAWNIKYILWKESLSVRVRLTGGKLPVTVAAAAAGGEDRLLDASQCHGLASDRDGPSGSVSEPTVAR